MLRNYIDEAYLPAMQRHQQLMAMATRLRVSSPAGDSAWKCVGQHGDPESEVSPAAIAGSAELTVHEPVEARATLEMTG